MLEYDCLHQKLASDNCSSSLLPSQHPNFPALPPLCLPTTPSPPFVLLHIRLFHTSREMGGQDLPSPVHLANCSCHSRGRLEADPSFQLSLNPSSPVNQSDTFWCSRCGSSNIRRLPLSAPCEKVPELILCISGTCTNSLDKFLSSEWENEIIIHFIFVTTLRSKPCGYYLDCTDTEFNRY